MKSYLKKTRKWLSKAAKAGIAAAMLFTSLSMEGVSAFAQSKISLYNEATSSVGPSTVNVDFSPAGLNKSGTMYNLQLNGNPALCLDLGLHAYNGYRYALVDTIQNSTINRIVNYWDRLSTNWNNSAIHSLIQSMIWAYQSGVSTSDYDKYAQIMKIAWEALNGESTYPDSNFTEWAEKALTHPDSSGTLYVYSNGRNGHQRFISRTSGERITYTLSTVPATESYKVTQDVDIRITKTDNASGKAISGIDFDFYRDGTYFASATTGEDGIAYANWTQDYTETATASAKYVNDFTSYSLPNQERMKDEYGNDFYYSRSEALNAASAEAQAKAKAAAEAAANTEHTYKAVETASKHGYYLDPNRDEPQTVVTGSGTANLSMTNSRITGSINLVKTDKETGNAVKNAEYTVYARNNILHPADGSVVYSAGSEVGKIITDGVGKGSLDGLYLGSYYVKETKAPNGYNTNTTDEYDVALDTNSNDVTVVTGTANVSDSRQPGKITITKKDDTTGHVLDGAVYGLYAKNDIHHPDVTNKVVYKAGTLVGRFETANGGTATLENLYLGDYTIKEITAPNNYVLDKNSYDVTLSWKNPNDSTTVVGVAKEVQDHRQEGKITITKHDSETDQTVPNAVYKLYAAEDIINPDQSGKVMYKKDAEVGTFPATATSGQAYLEHLYLGKYYIKETKAPDGYLLSDTRYDIELEYEGQNVAVATESQKVTDKVVRGTIEFEKFDRENYENKGSNSESVWNFDITDSNNDGAQGDATREGATYGLYARNDIVHKDTKTGVVTYNQNVGDIHEIQLSKGTDLSVTNKPAKAGTLLATAKTDKDGKIKFEHLYIGDYFIKEIEPSEGYLLDTTEYDVSITYEGQNVEIVDRTIDVLETVKRQAFQIIKVGSDGSTVETDALKGAEFTVWLAEDVRRLGKENAPIYDVFTTNEQGYAISKELPYGEYIVEETKVPAEHEKLEDFTVIISEDSRDPQPWRIMNDAPFTAHLEVVKKDAETGRTVKRVGATYNIIVNQDEPITIRTSGGKDQTFKKGDVIQVYDVGQSGSFEMIKDLVSNEDGVVVTPYVLPVGDYLLRVAPYGYVRIEDDIPFRITNEGVFQTAPDGSPIFTYEVIDQPVKGTVSIEKTGDVLTDVSADSKGNLIFKYTQGYLPGALFGVYAKEDIYAPDNSGALLYAKDSRVGDTFSETDENGLAFVENLPLGKYYIKEARAPEGYIHSYVIADFSIDYVNDKEDNAIVDAGTINYENERVKVDIQLVKKDIDTGEPISGAEFTMYAAEDIVNTYGEIKVLAGAKIQTVRSNSEGIVQFNENLPRGNYVIRETKSPDGYVSNDEEIYVDAERYNYGDTIISYSEEVTNTQTETVISKRDDKTNNFLPGTKLKLTDSKGNVVKIWYTSTDYTSEVLKGLTVGEKYTLEELEVPYGYIKADPVTFTVQDTDEPQNIVMYDKAAVGQITVSKEGEVLVKYENGQFIYEVQKLAGAKFEVKAAQDIYHPDGLTGLIYKKGDLVAELTTGPDGTATIGNLPLGLYEVTEVEAPNGFVLNKASQQVSITYKDENTEVVFGSANFENARQKLNLSVSKVDSESKKGLAGAEFTIYPKNDIVNVKGQLLVAKDTALETIITDDNGKAKFTLDLPLGEYYIKETKAPDGYASTDKVVDIDGTYAGQEVHIIFNTADFENDITKTDIIKEDESTKALIAGAELAVYMADEQGNPVGDPVEQWVSNKTAHRIEGLLVGQKYVLVELQAPWGYLKADNIVFTVPDTGDVQIHTMSDELVKGKINVSKLGEALVGYDEESENFVYENKPMAATFEIYANEDIKHPDGESADFYKKGDLVEEIVTDSKTGLAVSKELPLGQYLVVEKTAPDGQTNTAEKHEVTLEYADQNTPIVFADTEFVNEKQNVILDLTKYDNETNTPIAGAGFTIYANKDIIGYDGSVILKEGSRVAYAESDENGNIQFNVDLPIDLDSKVTDDVDEEFGKVDGDGNVIIGNTKSMFYMKETQRPVGYASSNAMMYIDTTYQGQNVKEFSISYDIPNEIITLEISKTDIVTGAPVPGAELSIIPVKEDGTIDEGAVFATWITEADNPETTDVDESKHIVKGIEPGKYVLREVLGNAADLGYVTANDVEFEVKDTGEIQKVEMKDDYTKVDFSKLDIETQEFVVGTELKVIPVKEDGSLDLGNVFETWVTENGIHRIDYLPIGNYVLRETLQGQAWDYGYVTAEDVEFTVKDTGDVQEVVMIDDFTKLEITKTDIVTGATVPGAELSIIPVKEDGTIDEGAIFATWITEADNPDTPDVDESIYYIERIPVGKYVLRETLGQAADLGYVTSKDVEFEVKDTGEIQKVDMDDDFTHTEFTKVDTEGQAVAGATMAIVPLDENGEPLFGETFTTWLTEADDPNTKDVDESKHVVEYLPIGHYLLVELSAPDGYVKAQPVEFEVKDTADVQAFTMIEKQVSFTKTDVTGENELPGAEIEVRDEDGNVVDQWTSTEDKHYISGLEEGKDYTLVEISAPEDYVVAEEVKFTVTTDKENQIVKMKDKQVDIIKKDVDGNVIEGATLEIINAKTKDIVDRWETGKEAHFANNLVEGQTYILREIDTPKGYVTASDIEFTVTADKENQSIEMIDKRVAVEKVDFADGTYVEGAKLSVTDKETGEIVDEWTTEKDVHYISGLKENRTYILTEVSAPTGYEIAESIEFTVTADKENQKVTMKDEKTEVTVTVIKTDEKSGARLAGAEFELVSDTGNVMTAVSDENGIVKFEHVIYGTYTLKETKAPEGYILSQEVREIVVDKRYKDGDEIQISFTNQLLPVIEGGPETGDNTMIMPFAMAALGSLAIASMTKKKKKEDDDEN